MWRRRMMAVVQISRNSVVVACEENVSRDVAGEDAVLVCKDGMYYGLEEVGARIWTLVAEPRTVGEICDTLLDEYEVEPDVCERDVIALLGELAAKGFVQAIDAARSS
jgi:Coenzyme PQQ synthesis protein D (PqqD)